MESCWSLTIWVHALTGIVDDEAEPDEDDDEDADDDDDEDAEDNDDEDAEDNDDEDDDACWLMKR
jgi:hypothetical protein